MVYKIGLLQKVKLHLIRGGVIAYPTESCYGLGCDPYNYKAIRSLIKLKRRDKTKGLIVIAGKNHQVDKLIKPLDDDTATELKQYWPGAFSLILDIKPNIPSNLSGKHKSVAVRVSKQKQVIQLCNYLDSAIVSTSANKSQLKSIKTYRECLRKFGNKVLVLPGVIGFAKNPSKIINLKTKQVLR
ncbi:MAG: L-threonylcarbamoyladenylate synthase [Proteobacteria bacterium]|jgi:L-threonylcarbamoyladenylate synthase|nr:L-threonylcarbamoyladenylate synthase [Pseudomonadota bacterium]